MPFYFEPQGTWNSLNKEAARLFAPGNEKADIRVFAGAAHAILEFTLGFREQFPLRKKYYYFKDLDPHFSLAATALAKAGLQVTALELSAFGGENDVARAEKVNELVATFDREFGFIFYPFDNPVTGELYPFAELEKALSEKSFPRLVAVYSNHCVHGLKSSLERNEAVMYAFSGANPMALLSLGDRMRFGSPLAPTLSPTPVAELREHARKYRRESAENAVCEFENSRLGDARPLFASSASRLYDRAVVYWEDMDGFAFLDALANGMDEPLLKPGLDWRFETTSLSRWGGIRTMDWLKPQGLTPEQIRGLVVIDARLLSSTFARHFVAARDKVIKMQTGASTKAAE